MHRFPCLGGLVRVAVLLGGGPAVELKRANGARRKNRRPAFKVS